MNTGSISDRFVWLGDNLLALEKDGVVFNYIADGNKNITQLVNLTTGEIANKYDYTPFGQLAKTDENVENPFKFSSEFHDEESGLVYYNYRYYNPVNGKWLSRDIIGDFTEKKNFNLLYGFVGNDAINKNDELGLEEINCEPTLRAGGSGDVFKEEIGTDVPMEGFGYYGHVSTSNRGLTAFMSVKTLAFGFMGFPRLGMANVTVKVKVSCYCHKGECKASIGQKGRTVDRHSYALAGIYIKLSSSGDTATATVVGLAGFNGTAKIEVGGSVGKDGIASGGITAKFPDADISYPVEMGTFTWTCDKK
ncbi:RHS repeat-associated core domain-containing protein [Lentisphaerota bacterium WC36G]|nr:RHS repeat-associated core domain-containing protein [Lentisphaerae bacterium WC36]